MEGQQKIRNTFPKQERLNSKKKIEKLFDKGTSKRAGCINMVYLITDQESDVPVKVMFSVPKRQFRRAVDRNLLRRRMREAYRLNKMDFTEVCKKENKTFTGAFIYTGKSLEGYAIIEEKIKYLLGMIELKT